MSASLYFDNAATMQPDEKMVQEYSTLCREYWWNPSSISQDSMRTRQAIENVRQDILKRINGQDGDKIIFTSGGTEANNLAIKGWCCEKSRTLVTHYDKNGDCDYRYHATPVVYTSSIEHPSVINPIDWLYEMGIIYSYNIIPVFESGQINLNALENRLGHARMVGLYPIFVSIMMANNEIGSINDIKKISKIVHQNGGVLHVDAVQAFTHMKIDVQDMGIDMMSVSGHKFGAPHGVGFLYVRNGIEINPLLHGGGQEKGMRSGTEDAPSIIMMGRAMDQAYENMDKDNRNLKRCKSLLLDFLMTRYDVKINSPYNGLANIVNVTFNGIDNEQLITNLDIFEGCQVSAGSACHAGVKEPSKVLQEIGLTEKEINSTIRISMDRDVTENELQLFVLGLQTQLNKLKML